MSRSRRPSKAPWTKKCGLDTNHEAACIIRFPKNEAGRKSHDFSAHLGRSIDAVVEGFKEQIERFLDGRDRHLSFATILGCCSCVPYFFEYLAGIAEVRGKEILISDINRSVVVGFIAFLKQSETRVGDHRRKYSFVKLVVSVLESRSLLSIEGGYPKNPFPNSNKLVRPSKPYSKRERTDIARALKLEVIQALQQKPGDLTSEQISNCLVAIALRTGRNETPLLEMRVDALRPHYKPGMRTLVLRKRRASRDWALPQQEWIEQGTAVLPGTVRIVERMIELTAPLRADAEDEIRNRLWLYRSRGAKSCGEVVTLTKAALQASCKKLSKRHNLLDEQGGELSVNLRRLRKTFSNRVYELSGQDIAVAAKAAGHTPRVAATSYLSPDEQSQENWRFMGEAFVRDLTSASPIAATPAGRCKDQYRGEYAPKNGATCISFINCFRCSAYVVTPEDLYKVLSLYRLIAVERERVGRARWNRVFANILRTIDRDIIGEGIRRGLLTMGNVEEARRRSAVDPHPFWASRFSQANDL